MRNSLALTASMLLCSSLAACGGGSSGGGGIVPNAAVGGLWLGSTTINGQGTYQLVGIVAEDGRGFILQDDGVMYWGTLHSSGNTISATMTGAGILGLPLWDGSASGSGTVNGSIVPRTSIAANASFTTALGSTTASTISLNFEAEYNDDSSLALIAGNYVDAMGLYAGVLNISPSGVLFMQDPNSGCVVNGQVAIIDPDYNAYDVQFTYSSCMDAAAVLNGVTFHGLAAYEAEYGDIVVMVTGTVAGAPYPDALVFVR